MKTKKTIAILSMLACFLALPLAAQTMDEGAPEGEPAAEQATELNAPEAQPADEGVMAADEGAMQDEQAVSDDGSVSEEASQAESDVAADEDSLPRTASPLGALALLSAVGAGAAVGVRRLRK